MLMYSRGHHKIVKVIILQLKKMIDGDGSRTGQNEKTVMWLQQRPQKI